jgi:transcriptional regulator with XRE-family HTH domain
MRQSVVVYYSAENIRLLAMKFRKDRLEQLCKALGWRQEDLAKTSGVGQSTISKIGKGQQPTDKTISKLATSLGVSAAYLRGETADPGPLSVGGSSPRIVYADEDEFEPVLREAFDKARHTTKDIADIKGWLTRTFRLAAESGDVMTIVRNSLDAAARLRSKNVPFSDALLGMEISIGSHPAAVEREAKLALTATEKAASDAKLLGIEKPSPIILSKRTRGQR